MKLNAMRHSNVLNAPCSADTESSSACPVDMGGFLESVEKPAYVIALSACKDKDAALDIVQDSMLRMVKSYGKKPADQWQPLFYKVLNNRITDHHRKRGFQRFTQWFGHRQDEEESIDAVDQLASNGFDPESIVDASELGTAINDKLQRLSEKQRQAILLRLWQGLSVKETAQAMGISEGSVKTHLSRAVHELREHLQDFVEK